MYQFYLKIGKINAKVSKIFISPETITSYFDVALNKRNAGQGSVFHVCIPLILDRYKIIIAMQKLKFMQEFIFAINVECLHSSLHAKVLMHNCARAKHAKHVFVAYKGF